MKILNFKKSILVLMLGCFVSVTMAQQKRMDANHFLASALRKAATEKKPVLLLCYASWNSWSKILDSVITEPACNNLLSKYFIIRKIRTKDIGLAKQSELMGADQLFDSYYKKEDNVIELSGNKIPAIYIYGVNGKKVGQYVGFPERIDSLIKTLGRSSSITTNEQQSIKTTLLAAYRRNGPETAATVFKKAFEKAKDTHKKVFMIFHASWCHWCHVLDTAMNDTACRSFFDRKFVIVHLVAHEDSRYLLRQNLGSEDTLAKYQGPDRNGIPFWIVFDENGKRLADYNGFPSPHYATDYAAFEKILKDTAAASDDDLAAVRKAFEKLSERNGIQN
jgi:thioredoxin-related protein